MYTEVHINESLMAFRTFSLKFSLGANKKVSDNINDSTFYRTSTFFLIFCCFMCLHICIIVGLTCTTWFDIQKYFPAQICSSFAEYGVLH